MAQEKLVQVTLDSDVTHDLVDPCFERVELKSPRVLQITYRKDRANAGQVLDAVQSKGYQIIDVVTREPDLEDVFLNLTTQAA